MLSEMDKESLVTEEQLVGLSNNDATHIAKGKRTKRLRLLSPFGVNVAAAATTVMTSSCSSANSSGDYGSFSSTTTTYEITDQEEEDMANCLILLAQGREGGGGGGDSHHHHQKQQQGENYDHDDDHGDGNKKEKGNNTSRRKFAEMATATNTKVGFFIYECKTCNRTFPSFQALGGHRASHKKPKLMPEEKKPPPSPSQPPPPPPSSQPQVITNYDKFEEAGGQTHIKSGPPISLQLGSHGHRGFHGNKAKIHECSICGSEFTSGQALGGHMRRHRASTNTTTTTQVVGMMSGIETSCNTTVAAAAVTTQAVEVQPRNILELDLNLPAPEEDLRESKFQFTATQKSMVLSAAPALVDCHY